MRQLVVGFMRCESGATAIEYAIIAAGISLAIVAAVPVVGTRLSVTYTSLQTAAK
jgi:pilus assembly protein Flp/PilA